MFGMKVKLELVVGGDVHHTELRNVTEVHYRYPGGDPDRVAFETDIHGTGITYDVVPGRMWVRSFEVLPETELAESF